MTVEQKARQEIDRLLAESGWIVQDRRAMNIYADPPRPDPHLPSRAPF